MNSHNWSEIGTAFDELAPAPAHQREARMAELRSQGKAMLADELASLLRAHDAADGFIGDKVERIFKSMAPGLALGPAEVRLSPGERILHFEILELLGEGSIAKVYLARDLELERLVALKISLSKNKEARTLAHFSVDGIVQVYSEHLTEYGGMTLRLICLQFISGPTLRGLTCQLSAQKDSRISLVTLLEMFPQKPAVFEPAALKWRQALSELSLSEASVLMCLRLAEVLSHAHAAGVLHLDIKPANILIDPYGRPFLSDFNVSTNAERLKSGDLEGLGGTPHFMPPEQARFFETGSAAGVDIRSDVYALGMVLKELLESLHFKDGRLDQILARATERNQNLRTASAGDLAKDLRAWLRVRLAERDMPPLLRGFGWIQDSPLRAVIILTILSQVLASVINITYNQSQIIAALTAEQNRIFYTCVAVYNMITYPLAIFGAVYVLRALFNKDAEAERARGSVLRIPLVMFLAISMGWLPGAWIFPRVIDHFAGPVGPWLYGQFAVSFSIAWLVSLTTSLALNLFVIARAFYPKYWTGCAQTAVRELRPAARLNRFLTFAAALVPMSAVLLIVLAPREFAAGDEQAFKALLLATVGLGLLNLYFVHRLTQATESSFEALKRPRTFG